MKSKDINLIGMPYFPGAAVGALVRGVSGFITDKIVLIQQHEIELIQSVPAGFIVCEGAPLSHQLIALFSFGVPAVIISQQQADQLKPGTNVLIDGVTGQITDNTSVIHHHKPDVQAQVTGRIAYTADKVPVSLRASVRHATAARVAVQLGAESIGLVRSEFLLPAHNELPNLEFYQRAFNEICQAASPLSVTIRLIDLSADKLPTWLERFESLGGTLGLQGARLYGSEPIKSLVATQIAAIDSLQAAYNIRLLIPYITGYEELDYWLTHVRQQLSREVPVGAMAETPSSVLDIRNWLKIADFVAIGCNDLMQCLYAVDRDRADLRNYLDPYAPFLYRFFRQIAESAEDHLDHVQLCGVLPQLQGVLPILLGLGYRVFSVDAAFIPYLTETINKITQSEAETLAMHVCHAVRSQEVLNILQLPSECYRPFVN